MAASERVPNYNFASDDAGWDSWLWSEGKTFDYGTQEIVFASTPTGSAVRRSDLIGAPLTAGKYYVVTVQMTRSAGSVRMSLMGGTTVAGTTRSTAGTHKERLLAASGNNTISLDIISTYTGRVKVISVVGPYDTATVGGS